MAEIWVELGVAGGRGEGREGKGAGREAMENWEGGQEEEMEGGREGGMEEIRILVGGEVQAVGKEAKVQGEEGRGREVVEEMGAEVGEKVEKEGVAWKAGEGGC